MSNDDVRDGIYLLEAAKVLESRSRKPKGIVLRALVKVLKDFAADVSQARHRCGDERGPGRSES